MGIEIGKTPPWEEAGAGEEPEEEILEDRTFHIFPFRMCVHFLATMRANKHTHTQMHARTHIWSENMIPSKPLWSVCSAIVKTVEAVKYCRSRCSDDVQPKPTDHMHPTTQQRKRLNHKQVCLSFISVSCSHGRRAGTSNREAIPRPKLRKTAQLHYIHY